MTPSIAELRRLLAEATPGPWDANISTGCVRYLGPSIDGPSSKEWFKHGEYVALCRWGEQSYENAHLVAAMHEALPALLDELERLRALAGEVTP